MKIIYVNCGVNSYLKVDHLIYRRNVTFAVAKRKPEKIQACTGFEPLTIQFCMSKEYAFIGK